jgi:hypothetical protein
VRAAEHARGGGRVAGFREQVDGHRRAKKLRGVVPETPADGQRESIGVEGDGALDVVDVDVDEKAKHGRNPTRR